MTADDSGATPRDMDTEDDAVRDVPVDDPSGAGSGSATHHAAANSNATTQGADDGAGAGNPGADNGDENNIAVRLEQLILGADRRYTPFQAARGAGVSMDLAARFWRAMGFADIGQVKALTEADVLALRRLSGLVEAGLLSEAMAIQVARSTGQTTARLADWQIDSFLEGLTEPQDSGLTRTEITYPLVELLLPE
ncbi:adenylate/guanylate cyclase domain-containing protein, partial [Streptomyces decoyicus]